MVQKNELKEKRNFGITSHMSRVMINQNLDSEFGEAGIGVSHSIFESGLRLHVKKYVSDIFLQNIPLVEKSYLTTSGIMINAPHMYVIMENYYLIEMYFGEETQ